jgi:hypothetical protein
MSKTINLFSLLLLLSGSSSQAGTFRQLVKRACWRFKSVRAEMVPSRSERIMFAAGIPTFALGLNALGDTYRTHQEKQIVAGLVKMAGKSGAASKKRTKPDCVLRSLDEAGRS